MKSEDYEDLFINLTEKVKEHVGEELVNIIDLNFQHQIILLKLLDIQVYYLL